MEKMKEKFVSINSNKLFNYLTTLTEAHYKVSIYLKQVCENQKSFVDRIKYPTIRFVKNK